MTAGTSRTLSIRRRALVQVTRAVLPVRRDDAVRHLHARRSDECPVPAGSDVVSILDELLPAMTATAWPAGLPDHLSASSSRCSSAAPSSTGMRYVLGRKEPPSGAMLWGISDGRAHAEANFNQKIESATRTAPVDEVKEAFAAILDEEVDKIGGARARSTGATTTPRRSRTRASTSSRTTTRRSRRRIQPTATEERFSLDDPRDPGAVHRLHRRLDGGATRSSGRPRGARAR